MQTNLYRSLKICNRFHNSLKKFSGMGQESTIKGSGQGRRTTAKRKKGARRLAGVECSFLRYAQKTKFNPNQKHKERKCCQVAATLDYWTMKVS